MKDKSNVRSTKVIILLVWPATAGTRYNNILLLLFPVYYITTTTVQYIRLSFLR